MRHRRSWFCSGVLLVILVVTGSAQPPAGHNEVEKGKGLIPTVSPDEARKQLAAADKFAREVAGDDESEYYRVRATALRQMRLSRSKLGAHAGHIAPKDGLVSPFTEARARAQAKAAQLASITNDPAWRANNKRLFEDVMKGIGHPQRIFGGELTAPGEFPDCVAVGGPGMFCCTGTLIGPNVVLTAGHCGDGGCAHRVYVGTDANHPDPARIYTVKKAIVHEGYNPFTLANDLTVLILEKDVGGVTPRRIADTKDVEAAYFVRLVGFGYTEFGIFGVQNKVDVAIASASCDCKDCPDKYGCHQGLEMVAGGSGKDTCNGDSGGPAYLAKDKELYLVGATSRATANSVMNCGDGGVYVRVDKYRDWIIATAKANGGKLPY